MSKETEGFLLLAFLVLRFTEDYDRIATFATELMVDGRAKIAQEDFLIAIDIIIALFTMRLFWHYCRLSKVRAGNSTS